MAEVGYASLGIIPSFAGFERNLTRGMAAPLATSARTGGARFGDLAGREAGRRFGGRFTSAVKTAGLLGGIGGVLGIASFVKDSVQLEATYGKTMAQIRVATEAPADQLERLDELAIKLGKDTIFSASDASSAMLELAKNGIRPATIEAGALSSALTLAAAGDTDLTDAATTMGNALNAFSLKGRKARQVAAALAGAANASSASVQSLAEGLQQSAATAADTGLSVQETTAVLSAFANAGIAGSDAGTSLKTMLSRLLPTTNKAQKAMELYGLSFVRANGEFKGAVEIAGELQQGLGDLSASERSAALNTIFGSDARRAATLLVKEGADGIRDYVRATSDQQAADRMAKANMEGTSGAIERLAGAWETAKLEFGKALAPAAVEALDAMAAGVDEMGPKLADATEWFIEEGVPALSKFAGHARDAGENVADLVGWLNDLPKPAKIAGLTALLAGGAALKLRGGGGGALGGAGRALGMAKPVPVFVTNPGGLGGGADVGGGGKGGWVSTAGRAFGVVAGAAIVGGLATAGIMKLQKELAPKATEKGIAGTPYNAGFNGLLDDLDKGKDRAVKMRAQIDLLNTSLDKTRGPYRTSIEAPRLPAVMQLAKQYDGILEGIPRTVRTDFVQSVQRNNVIEPGDGRGGKTSAGVSVNIYGDVRPADSREFYRDVQRRSRSRAGGGR